MGARKTSSAKAAVTPHRVPASARRAARELGLTVELPSTIAWWEAFYRVIRRIPAGRVCTYGVVAMLAGHPRAARHVGHALSALKEGGEARDVPWHRVLGSRSARRAAISIKDPVGGALQRKLLEQEGVRVDERGSVPLDAFGWPRPKRPPRKPPAPEAKAPARPRAPKSPPGPSGSGTRKPASRRLSTPS